MLSNIYALYRVVNTFVDLFFEVPQWPERHPPPQPASTAIADTEPAPKKGRRLTLADRYVILDLHRNNPEMPYAEIARLCKVDRHTARMTILAAGRGAVDLMAGYAEPMLRDWIGASTQASARGDHRPAKEWLLHAGILDPLPDAGKGNGPAVVIINAPMPGMPGYAEVRGTIAPTVIQPGRVAEGQPGQTLGANPQNPATPDGVAPDKRNTPSASAD